MATRPPSAIPFPLSSFPGADPQESAGRLINCYVEPLGEAQSPTGPAKQVWRRSPGLSQFNNAATGQTGYRGGLLVQGASYEIFSNNCSSFDSAGNITNIGAVTGTKKVSIARNQAAAPQVIAVDVDNGAFQIAPAFGAYTGAGVLPQPNSVCFQDGYFFFTIGDNRIFATAINSLAMNALTFQTCVAKADVSLLRGIAYNGLLWAFTTGSCEVYQDTAQPYPGFPYTRQAVLEFGLVQANAIAGWETGFSELCWVAQDYGVYWATPGTLQPQKVSPPDLEKLIDKEVRAGNTLEASCYAFAGKKFWVLSSPNWCWEFNITTLKWNERWSLQTTGLYGRWRASGGHPAFGKWLMGDYLSGNILFLDSQNFSENGAVQLMRVESGPVRDFPYSLRIARADFDFAMGEGAVANTTQMTVLGASAGTANAIRLRVNTTTMVREGDTVVVSAVTGTTEANGTWLIHIVDAYNIELNGSNFTHAYTGGGVVLDTTSQPNAISPTVAVSCSKDGGYSWGNPLVRALGKRGKGADARATVKNLGQSSPLGVRWRLDVSDAVYTSLMGGTQSSSPREI